MAGGSGLVTFLGFEELTGKKFLPASLPAEIARFSTADLLTVGARMNFLTSYPLLLPVHRDFNPEPFLASNLLAKYSHRLALIRDWPNVRRVFSRQQGLTFLNLALRFGSASAGQDTATPEGQSALGDILLKINETLFSRDQLRVIKGGDARERRLAMDQQFGFLMELYNLSGLALGMVRVDVMLTEVFSKKPTLSLQELFRKRKGLTATEYRDLLLAIVAYYLSAEPADMVGSPGRLVIEPGVFCGSNKIPVESLELLLTAESHDVAEHRAASAEIQGRLEQDFSHWRQFPFFTTGKPAYHCADPALLIEKFGSGFRWTLANACSDDSERERVLAAFGELFEGYCDWVLRSADDSLGGRFHSFPSFGDAAGEAFDGLLLAGSHALVLEYRLGTMPIATTTSVETTALVTQTAKIFGGGGGAKLANRIEAAFASEVSRRREIVGVESEQVRRVTPVFVVYDPFWRFSLPAQRAAAVFDKELERKQLRPDVVCDGAVIVDIEAMETLVAGLSKRNLLSEVLRRYLADRRQPTLREFLRHNGWAPAGDWAVVAQRLERMWNGVGQRYFGEDVWFRGI